MVAHRDVPAVYIPIPRSNLPCLPFFSFFSLFFSCCVVLESADTNKLFTPGNSLTPTTLKPFGYSLFPKELVPTPKSWVDAETNGKMIWCKRHDHVRTQDPSGFLSVVTDVLVGWPFCCDGAPRGVGGGYQGVCTGASVDGVLLGCVWIIGEIRGSVMSGHSICVIFFLFSFGR